MKSLKVTTFSADGIKTDQKFEITRLYSTKRQKEIKPHRTTKHPNDDSRWTNFWFLTMGSYLLYRESLSFDNNDPSKPITSNVEISILTIEDNDKMSYGPATAEDIQWLVGLLKGKQKQIISPLLDEILEGKAKTTTTVSTTKSVEKQTKS